MTEAIREQLSAFVDGELSPVEAELLLKRVDRDPALRASLDRYLLLGAAIRSETTGAPSQDFAARVAKALDKEQSGATKISSWAARLTRSSNQRKPLWIAGGSAVAAGVIAMAMLITPHGLGVQNSSENLAASNHIDGQVDGQVDEATSSAQAADEPIVIPADAVRASQWRQQVEGNFGNQTLVSQRDSSRLASYVMAHSQYSSPLNRRNVLTGLLVEEPSADELRDTHAKSGVAISSSSSVTQSTSVDGSTVNR